MSDVVEWTPSQKLAIGVAVTAVVAGAVAYRATLPVPGASLPSEHSVILPAAGPGESCVLRSTQSPDKLLSRTPGGPTTLWNNFLGGVSRGPHRNCLGSRAPDGGPYRWKSFRRTLDDAKAIGSGLQNGLGFEPQDFVGIYSVNREEWTITEQGCNGYSMVVVPLYDTLGTSAVSYILGQTEMRVVFVSGANLHKLVDSLSLASPSHVRYIVCFDGEDDVEHFADARHVCKENHGIDVLTYAQVLELGRTSPKDPVEPKPDDLATICYTSGTTGDPKGVMLTHANIMASATGIRMLAEPMFKPHDVHISYLPLAHMFERICQVVYLGVGASIGFFRGDVKKHLFDDIATLRPTVFPSVPRLFTRLYDVIMGKLQALTGFRKFLFERAWAAKKEALARGSVRHPLWDALVFRKIAARLGGRVRLMVTGSAPISPQVLEFLRICFSVTLLEGYGQTETGAAVSGTRMGDTTGGHVGSPLVCTEVKLVDVPEMEYTTGHTIDGVSHPQGELCFRGPNVCKGYFKMPEKTAETIDQDGWLHSGDVGMFLPDGKIRIIDRKKNIFKLAHGEYVAPEKIEGIMVQSPFLAQVFVHGDSLKACLVAIAVPDEEYAMQWAEEKYPGSHHTLEDVCAMEQFESECLKSATAYLDEAGVVSYEKPRAMAMVHEPFSVENGVYTPTFKLVRNVARKKYQSRIEEMYHGM